MYVNINIDYYTYVIIYDQETLKGRNYEQWSISRGVRGLNR